MPLPGSSGHSSKASRSRFRDRSLIAHVIWRSLLYTAVVLAVTFAEHLFDAWRTQGSLDRALSGLWASRDFHHFLALNITIALSFLLYHTFAELDRRLGQGSLRRMLLARPHRAPSGIGGRQGIQDAD